MTEIEWAEKVAGFLLAETPGAPRVQVAFLKSGAAVYFSRHLSPPPAHAPFSPITDLIQGIYEHDPAMARRHVRNRIFTNAAPTSMCLGMVKVAARRLTAGIEPAQPDGNFGVDPSELIEAPAFYGRARGHQTGETSASPTLPERFASAEEAMRFALALAAAVPREGARYESDRPIGAVLVAADGSALASAVNTNARNRTLHAELNLAQAYYARHQRPLPAGAKVYVSLKPCRMCAAMLWRLAENPRELRVFYHELDPGPNARETILDAGSFDRKQACAQDRELALLQLEEQLTV